MTDQSVKHATFVIEKTYDASPARVYAAWADSNIKAKWFQKPDEFDFRVGGRESNQGGPPEGPVYTFNALYQEIVPEQRIVYTYTMDMDQTRISVSITTVEFKIVSAGTQVIFTEQGAFFDDHDTPDQREHGTNEMLDSLGAVLTNG